MSIIIQNITFMAKPSGPHQYELRINREVIAKFVHNREDGLAECLRKAAAAAQSAAAKDDAK